MGPFYGSQESQRCSLDTTISSEYIAERKGKTFAAPREMPNAKRFVYILTSIVTTAEYYVGVTSDMAARLIAHNAGLSPHTARHRPWRTLVVIEFDEQEPALKFEQYLKTGSGREFARRHFRQAVRGRQSLG